MTSKEAIGWNDVEVLVVGAGTMGASLAQAYAQNGFAVGLLDIDEEILDAALETIDRELDRARGRIFTPQQVEAIQKRLVTTTDYKQACSGPNLRLVIESATERLDVKEKIFRQLDEHCSANVVFASNSSSLDIDTVAGFTKRPDKVVWMHYFYLPHKNRAGEYAGSTKASEDSKDLAAYYLKLGGKIPTPILSSRRGGAADIVFVSLLLEATRMLEEGYDIASIEEGGRRAYGMPMGFLALMDATGLEVGYYSMKSFSDPTGPDDELIGVYQNFFAPPEVYAELIEKCRKAEDKAAVRWVSDEAAQAKPEDEKTVEKLRDRFLAVGFMTASEVVDSGVITAEEMDQLAQNAFLWAEGPFAIMNKLGTSKSYELVRERAQLAESQGIHFPIPTNLKSLEEKGKPWPLAVSPVVFSKAKGDRVARITLSRPKSANALDNEVFGDIRTQFQRAYEDDSTDVVVFDTAPIKTFIAGANVSVFLERVKQAAFQEILNDTRMWQEVMFSTMTGAGKPKIALVDGQAFGGGVEVAMAFAADPDTVVIATDRTTFAMPEARLGIYPGLRGTLLLPWLIYRATDDAELAVAMARYYVLAAGTLLSTPGMIRLFSLADIVVPAHQREEAVKAVARAIIDNKGKIPDSDQLKELDIETVDTDLTFAEREEMRVMKDLFLQPDLLPTLCAYARGWKDPFVSGEHGAAVLRIARRVYFSSPNAAHVANDLISRGFADLRTGAALDDLAERELTESLIPVFRHPDALEGLSAFIERRFPDFNRTYPL